MERAAEDVAIEEALADVRHRGFLGRLSGGLVDEIIQSGTLVYHPAGSTSFPGRDGTQGSVVVAGLVRYFLSGLDGRQVTIRICGGGRSGWYGHIDGISAANALPGHRTVGPAPSGRGPPGGERRAARGACAGTDRRVDQPPPPCLPGPGDQHLRHGQVPGWRRISWSARPP